MKLSTTLLLASAAGSAAFTTTPLSTTSTASALRMADASADDFVATEAPKEEAPVAAPEPPKPELPKMSQALPFMSTPAALDGTIVGDAGFDPLGFSKNKDDLLKFREAEIKHARLAMLAAAGWPLSELFDGKIATWLNMNPLIDASDRVPSVLNGGLGKVSPVYWGVCLIAAAAIDVYGISKSTSNAPDYFPGNLGFDPLGLYPKDEADQRDMQLKELKNGRLAMMAITGFAIQEFVSKMGVIDETPAFFKPLGTVLHEYANAGYIAH